MQAGKQVSPSLRMKQNIKRYEILISYFSDAKKFPSQTQFTDNMKALSISLSSVNDKFVKYFNPARYIEDSAIMYIQ